jgi:hypothetical protein
MPEKRKRPPTAWKPGQSGNPAGRTPGVEKVRQLLEPKREELVAKAVEMALAGDATALRICLDRISPPPRSESAPVLIPGLAEATGMAGKARAVIDAAGRGEISPTVATELLSALAGLARAIEVDELAKRIEALEALESTLYPRI